MTSINVVIGANIYLNATALGMSPVAVEQSAAHELGHSFGFGSVHPTGTDSVMSPSKPDGSCTTTSGATGPSASDIALLKTEVTLYKAYFDLQEGSEEEDDPLGQDGQCDAWPDCPNPGGSPIIVSPRGNRLSLTDRASGVQFDLNSDGFKELIPWTAGGSGDAFLVLDRNGNGVIDNGGELFGDFTLQFEPSGRNGFEALAIYDLPELGGNGDGRIDGSDHVFFRLQLWVDQNHDGLSKPDELEFVSESGIDYFDLEYRFSRRTDRYGNEFRYVSKVFLNPERGRPPFTYAVDVFFPAG